MKEMNYRFNCSDYVLHDGDEPILKPLDKVAICFDSESGTLHKHGDPVIVQSWCKSRTDKLRACGITEMAEMANDLIVITGRFPLDELNKCLTCTGYVLKMYQKIMEGDIEPSDPLDPHGTKTKTAQNIESAVNVVHHDNEKANDIDVHANDSGKRGVVFRKPKMR